MTDTDAAEPPMPAGPWPFPDPPDAEAITLDRILDGSSPLRLVTRDLDDGTWQFLDGGHVFEEDAVAVLLGEMLQFDPALEGLADLPLGWHARRDSPSGAWTRAEGEPAVDVDDPDDPGAGGPSESGG